MYPSGMAKSGPTKTDIIKRSLFCVFLVVLGLSLEILWQSTRDGTPAPQAPGDRNVVLIGGSICEGLAPRIQSSLRRLNGHEGRTVVDYSSPHMSVDEATVRARQALDAHRPSHVLFMLGLQDTNDDEKWLAEMRSLLTKGAHDELISRLVERADEGRFLHPYSFVFRNAGEFSRPPLNRRLIEEVGKSLDRLGTRPTQRAEDEAKRIAFAHFAVLIGRVATSTLRPPSPDDFQRDLFAFIGDLRKWAAQIGDTNYESFVASDDANERFRKTWFWIAWPRDAGDPIDYFVSHPKVVGPIILVPPEFLNPRTIEATFPEGDARRLLVAFSGPKTETQMPFSLDETMSRRLSDLFEIVRAGGARPVLIHYPAARLPLIDEVAARFRVPVAASNSRLPELIRKEGRSVYLNDRIGDTGHLTDAGLEIFGREIAADLARIE